MDKLRVGLIGYGMRAGLARELGAGGGNVVAICDPREDRRDKAREDYPDAVVTSILEEMLEDDLDAAMVLTPDGMHAAGAIAAMEAGLAVFCEKPMAINVEDITQVNMRLAGGVLASYQQCHFTPDYWRNYTVIGTRGRIENFGDTPGSTIGAWTKRISGSGEPDMTWRVAEVEGGHGGADSLMIAEFLRSAREGGPTDTSAVAARNAVATGVAATISARSDSAPVDVSPVSPEVAAYFE